MYKRRFAQTAIIIAVSLAIELTVCNFSAWKSLFYSERLTFENMTIEGAYENASGEYTVYDDNPVLHIPDVDKTLHNLFIGITPADGGVLSYTVNLTDEGNYYPYALPEQTIVTGLAKSRYPNIYPAGKVKSIDISLSLTAGNTFTISSIGGNARVPFMFSFVRFFVILCVLLLFYKALCANQWQTNICTGSKKQLIITCLTALALMAVAWALAHVNPICVTSPWPHHKQYQELAEAMAKGHFYLDAQPSEALINTENPYDTIYLQAGGIDYLADYSYYDGRYYVYFGVVPELLLYLPFYIITGHNLPNYIAVFLFYCGFILAVFALFWEIVKRWFPDTPYFIYLTVSTLSVCCGNYLFIIARPDLYDAPIMAANMFTAGGLHFWIKGKYAQSQKTKRSLLFIGSLCMALVAGCRPQMLLFSLLALPLFQDTRGRKHIPEGVFFCVPYIIVAAGIMYYNNTRFSSVLDFGATYSLTSNDMTRRGFNSAQALLGLWHYFLRPPAVTGDFPFLQGVQISSDSYMGKLNAEYTYGGMLASNAFLWIFIWTARVKDFLKEKKIYVFSLLCIMISAALAIIDVTGAGILQRYMADMIWGVWLAAALFWFSYTRNALKNGSLRPLMLVFTLVCLLQAFYGFGVIFGNGDLSVNVRASNPELYYYLSGLCRF